MSQVRVHSCVFQQRVVEQKAEPNPHRSCNCRRLATQIEADELVRWGEASRLVLARERKELEKPCDVCAGGEFKSSCTACKKTGKKAEVKINNVHGRDIVLVAHRTKTNRVSTPRVPTIEAKHILRAYVSRESVKTVEAVANLSEDALDDDITNFVHVRLGYGSDKEQQYAQERIEEYGRMVAMSLKELGAQVEVVITGNAGKGQRVIHPGKTEPVGGREKDWGRAI